MRIALISVALGAAVSCQKGAPVRQPSVPVRVATVARISAPVFVVANGVVEPQQAVSVEAQVGGVLTEVSFREGDEVASGQVLFRIDPRPFEAAVRQAQATLARDLVQAQNALRDAERYSALVAKDYVTKSQADQATATAASLHATVQSDSAALESAQLNLAYSTIRAPISGRTGSLLVRQGNVVKPSGTPLVVINQIHPILVRFPVTQGDFLALSARAAGGAVPVSVVTADSIPFAESGTLSFIDNEVDSLTGMVSAKARFDNASRKLWPGEYVRVSAQVDRLDNVLAVPSAALVAGQNGSYVYVVDSALQARMRPVTPGRTTGDLTVLADGVAVGDRVVIDGQSRLVPGSKVEIQARPSTPAADQGAAQPADPAPVQGGKPVGKPAGKAPGKAGGRGAGR